MLHLIQSNFLEILADRLGQVLAQPAGDPFAPETVVVQNVGMGRWLSQYLARRTGIAANIHYPLPARFVWQVFAGQIGQPDDLKEYDRGVLPWRILAALADLLDDPAFARLKRYLADDRDGRKGFQLAGVIGDLFDQYLVYRPEMLLSWEAGRDENWQAILWRRLAQDGIPHRARLLQAFREKVQAGGLDPARLPARVFLFGISSLAPAYLEIMHSISTVVEVYLFHVNPCRQYWADLASDGEMARKRRHWRRRDQEDVSRYFVAGNPLLASFGQVGREFTALLAELDVQEQTCYHEPEGDMLLARLQRDLLDLRDPSDPAAEPIPVAPDDRSVQFHSCYSRMREVQVLHDHLLELFEADAALKPGDILVMAPDIEAYAPAVPAVFNSDDQNRAVPWSMADLAVRTEQAMVDAFLQILALAESRCTAPEILSLLETEPVRQSFGFGDDELNTIRNWIRDSGIRWGFDADHRHRFSSAVDGTHSWRFGMDRLFFSYFAGPTGSLFNGIASCAVLNSEDADILGRLAGFLALLQGHCTVLRQEHPPGEWGELLLRILDDFLMLMRTWKHSTFCGRQSAAWLTTVPRPGMTGRLLRRSSGPGASRPWPSPAAAGPS